MDSNGIINSLFKIRGISIESDVVLISAMIFDPPINIFNKEEELTIR